MNLLKHLLFCSGIFLIIYALTKTTDLTLNTCYCLHISISFFYRGENTGSQTQEVLEQAHVLKRQISDLEAQEKELDNQKTWLENNIKQLNHDPITNTYPSITETQF